MADIREFATWDGGEPQIRKWIPLEEHEAIIRRQARAALRGMDAAKAISSFQLKAAARLNAESSPDALESERQANAKLTQELSLAEEGLANYAQEVERLQVTLLEVRKALGLPRDSTDSLVVVALRLRAELHHIRNESLVWARTCPCTCDACEKLSSVIRQSGLHPTGESPK